MDESEAPRRMPEPDPSVSSPQVDPMTAEDALSRMERVTQQTGALRVRTEGLTLVIWGLCMAASYLTLAGPYLAGRGGPGGPGRFRPAFNEAAANFTNGTFGAGGPRGPPPTEFFLSAYAPLVWALLAVVITVAIWRSASLSFRTGVTTPRIAIVMGLWLVLFAAAHFVFEYIEVGPHPWHLLAWSGVIALFAVLDPIKFTRHSRTAILGVAVVVLLAAVYAFVANLDPRDTSFLSGVGLGLPMLTAGLYLMFRG